MKVSVSEAKAKLPALIARVEGGADDAVFITRRGKTVALLIGSEHFEQMRAEWARTKAAEVETIALRANAADHLRRANYGPRGLSLAELLKASRE